MPRVASRSWIGLALAGAIAGASFDAISTPPDHSVPGQIAALQAQVASLAAEVAALQGAAAPVPVWQATGNLVRVQRNDGPNAHLWTMSRVGSLILPAGSYLVVAKTVVQDSVVPEATFLCFLRHPEGPFDETIASSVQHEPATMVFQGVVTLEATGTILLECGASGPESASGFAVAHDTRLVAIQATLQ